MRSGLTKRQIFEMVARNEITSKEGAEMIDALGLAVRQPLPVHFFMPEWKLDRRLGDITVSVKEGEGPFLVFEPQGAAAGSMASLSKRLGFSGNPVIAVQPGEYFAQVDENSFRVNPLREEDYGNLAKQLAARGIFPAVICCLWSPLLMEAESQGFVAENIPSLSSRLLPLFYLVKSLSDFKSLKRFFYIYNTAAATVDPLRECASAMSVSLGMVYPAIQFSSIGIEGSQNHPEALTRIIGFETGSANVASSREVFYNDAGRHLKQLKKMAFSGFGEPAIVEGGTYMITGGGGALGFIFARHLAEKYKAAIVLIDIMDNDSAIEEKLSQLRSPGAKVHYYQADVSDRLAMTGIVAEIHKTFGSINGVIHAAGKNNDISLSEKNAEEFLNTLEAKIDGTVVLDWATRNETLDFFVMFSSTAAILGDFGQCDYALASRFMDSYRGFREQLAEKKLRSGRTAVIDWHLWKDGGMHLSAQGEALYMASSGLGYLESAEGVRSFEEILSRRYGQTMVITGDPAGMERFFGTTPAESPASAPADLEGVFGNDIRELAASIIKLEPQKLDMEETLGDFGFDSISLKTLADQLNSRYNLNVSPALFFKHPSLKSLERHLLEKYRAPISRIYVPKQPTAISPPAAKDSRARFPRAFRPSKNSSSASGNVEQAGCDIAIIGAGGIFPGSWELDEFWNNLCAGKDLITEVPAERWDWRAIYDDSNPGDRKQSVRWGGFISDVDTFDGRFFNISPREAELMDPQNRLFLEVCWKTIEDAGYDASSLAGSKIGVFAGVQFSDYEQLLRETGPVTAQVGTGNSHAMISNRVSYVMDFHGPSESIDTACSGSLVAVNRAVRSVRGGECDMALCGGVSLILSPANILAAAQLGVLSPDGRCKTFDRSANGYVKGEGVGAVLIKPLAKAIEARDHIYAVVKGSAVNHGGKANSLTAPNSESQADVLVAAYKDAGIGIETVSYIETHGTGTELGDPVEIDGLKMAFAKLSAKGEAGVAQGNSCGLGSIKTNIGHLEPASGIASLIKVILAMKHRILPASLHLKHLNPYIDFQGTPFYVVDRRTEWERAKDRYGRDIPLRAGVSCFGFGGANAHVVLEEFVADNNYEQARAKEQVECLVVLSAKDKDRLAVYAGKLARFIGDANQSAPEATTGNGKLLPDLRNDLLRISSEILSVSTEEIDIDNDLLEYGFEPMHFSDLFSRINEKYNLAVTLTDVMQYSSIKNLSEFLANRCESNDTLKKADCPLDLGDVAYTLQLGRTAQKSRLAIVASTLDELVSKLMQYSGGNVNVAGLIEGEANQGNSSVSPLEGDEWEEYVDVLLKGNKLQKIAKMWVSGTDIDWSQLYRNRAPRRISLPTYPFARQRYWIPEEKRRLDAHAATESSSILHPLIHQNTSTLAVQRYSTRFLGNEFFLADHVINGKKVLPGVAYIEMARAAGQMATARQVVKIGNIVWVHPIVVEEKPVLVHIDLIPAKSGDGRVNFEIYNNSGAGSRSVHARGKLIFADKGGPGIGNSGRPQVDIPSLVKPLNHSMGRNVCYNMFADAGIAYGPGFQAIQQMYCGGSEAVACIELPDAVQRGKSEFMLHPSLLDAALQSVIGLREAGSGNSVSTFLPFSVGEVEIWASLPEKCYVRVATGACSVKAESHVRTFNVEILDTEGRLLVRIIDFTVKELKGDLRGEMERSAVAAKTNEYLYFVPGWRKDDIVCDQSGDAKILEKNILLFATDNCSRDAWTKKTVLVKKGTGFSPVSGYDFEIDAQDESHYIKLLDTLERQTSLPDAIVHLWALGDDDGNEAEFVSGKNSFVSGVFSIFLIAREILKRKPKADITLLFLFTDSGQNPKPHYSAVAGLFRSLQREHPRLVCKTIRLEDGDQWVSQAGPTQVAGLIKKELAYPRGDVEVRYDAAMASRFSRIWNELPVVDGAESGELVPPVKPDGAYLVTGGLGKLGMLFAEFLARRENIRLALTDHVELSEQNRLLIAKIGSQGGDARYWKADLSKMDEVENVVKQVKEHWGRIDGVIHCAGVNRDAPVVKKSVSQIAEVLGPKVLGTLYLDEATKNETLDFFVLFSSFTTVVGNAGQSDYAYANNFLDFYAEKREVLRREGKRTGKTLSIDWPLWKSGGMAVDLQTERLMATTTGMRPLTNEDGLRAFGRMLKGENSRVAMITGDGAKIRKAIFSGDDPDIPIQRKTGAELMGEDIGKKIRDELIAIAMGILKMPATEIDSHLELQEYGFDSITLTEFANKINDKLGLEVTPAIFFELDHSTIAALANHLRHKYSASLRLDTTIQQEQEAPNKSADNVFFTRFEDLGIGEHPQMNEPVGEDVAIIGMNAILPRSEEPDMFWEHLLKGDDLIGEVPADRWDWRSLFGEASGARWGGFMEDIDKFDPLFFGISQREAELMDPQQRIILKTVWAAIEDAGYRAGVLSGLKVGVFIGVSTTDYYELWRASSDSMEPYMATGMSHSIVANRISYLLNLHGPSESVDTACSSSLVAIHRGVEAIHNGSCRLVIAGGVNLLISPTLFQAFDSAGMLSPDGRCRTFDRRANGYVRGEGAGALLLKPLAQAVADRDHIYGIVKGGALNHGGRANSLTAPNALAQADLLVEAYRTAGIDPTTVSFIEAHGTGTTLGDPVEINGLKLAFSRLYELANIPANGNRHCGIGSVKTNIGHLEAAAGIAGVIKTLLALKHQTLPATVHFQELNPFIDLQGSPFYILNETKHWTRLRRDDGAEVPRRAGVSSYGFGGANAHIILEEYVEPKRPLNVYPHPYIFVLSAKTEGRLLEYAKKTLRFLQKIRSGDHGPMPPDLIDFIYTLQVGREPLDARLAIIVSDVRQLLEVLGDFCTGKIGAERAEVFRSNGDHHDSRANERFVGDARGNTVETILERRDWRMLARLWVSGADIDWERLYEGFSPARVSLPTYPFEKIRYWFDSFHKAEALPGIEPAQLSSASKPGKLLLQQKRQEQNPESSGAEVKRAIAAHLARILHADEGELAENVPMQEFGLDSIGSVELVKALNQDFGLDLKTVALYDYSTIEKLSRHIAAFAGGILRAVGPEPKSPKPQLKMKLIEIETGNSPTDAREVIVAIKDGIVRHLSHILHAKPEEINHETPMQEIGLDSIGGTELISALNQEFSLNLKAAALYDYPTVSKLAEHILPIASVASTRKYDRHSQPAAASTTVGEVAVIGMSARLPGSRDVWEFWENLKRGVDAISEVPKSRWDVDHYFDPDPNKPDKIYCKWGGFIEGIDEFDPLFFRIAPSDAEVIDPQQRLFIQECVKAFEDAGYSEEELSEKKCGVFVGVLNYNEYSQILQGNYSDSQLGHLMLGNSNSILAARTCYFLNLKGPALAIDTACSSSLVAIHQAYKSLQDGETEMMLAGGVILCMIHERYLLTSKTGALSPSGRCRTFDNGADGYVPGEGVGVILMKTLENALRDRDHIYGVIKGSALNQDGTTNGITAPSAESQKSLELEVYRKYNIHPESIGYVEAHGTGTKLGDPIEMTALTAAFREYTRKNQFCAIGSVKTNIGHLASAAGVASVIKVLLSLTNRQIPPSLHFTKANEHIDFSETPFFVNTELKDWETLEGSPRRATVSAFGLSGTNCHLVIQEPPPPTQSASEARALPFYIAAFSAKTPAALDEKLLDMKAWLKHRGADVSFADVSFTLLAGRSHYAVRRAFVVRSVVELSTKIDDALSNSGFDSGNDHALNSDEGRRLIGELKNYKKWECDAYKAKLSRLAELYVSGANLDWRELFSEINVRRISLPTYPFARESFWVQARKSNDRIHPFIDANESTFFESKFRLRLKGDEFFITDHVIEGKKIFPAVAYAEMARAAGELAAGRKVSRLKNIIFAQPIAIGDKPKDILINLLNNNGKVEFRICTAGENGTPVEHSQGSLAFESGDNDRRQSEGVLLDIGQIKSRCAAALEPTEIYRMFRLGGVTYGDGFQTIKELRYCENESLAKLELTDALSRSLSDFVMHPSFMDGLLQSTLGLALGDASRFEGTNYLPFVLGEIEFFNREPLPRTCYAYATRAAMTNKGSAGVMTFNIQLLDATGKLRIRMKNFSVRAVQEHDLSYMRPVWRQIGIPGAFDGAKNFFDGPVIVFDANQELSDGVRNIFENRKIPSAKVITVLPAAAFKHINENLYSINPADGDDYKKLMTTLQGGGSAPVGIIHNWCGALPEDMENSFAESMEKGIYSVFYLVKALTEQKNRKKTHILYMSPLISGSSPPQYAAVGGFTRSIAREHSRLVFKSLETEQPVSDGISVEGILLELANADNSIVRYTAGQRLVRRLEKIDIAPADRSTQDNCTVNRLKTGGVYIITGGGGGLGLIFAEYLAKEYCARLVLTGRSELDDRRKEVVDRLDRMGGGVVYIQADISLRENVERLVKKTKELFHRVDGVIHGAGVIDDGLLTGKTIGEFEQVLAPKVWGTLHLDHILQDEELDFFVLFSAVAGEFGNPGQSDYAYANSFLDHFAVQREKLRQHGLRSGKTISIDWTLWQDGGMKLDERMLALRREAIGVKPLSSSLGINSFLKGLELESSQLILAHGDEAYIQKLHALQNQGESSTKKPTPVRENDSDLILLLRSDLVALVDRQLKLKGSTIDPVKNLREYGFDSINLTVLANRINEEYSLEITPAVFFELDTMTIDSLSRYLLEEYSEPVSSFYARISPVVPGQKDAAPDATEVEKNVLMPQKFDGLFDDVPLGETPGTGERGFPVAIIGMSGRMPRSDSLEVFWGLLERGESMITEIPADRWDWRDFVGDHMQGANKTDCRWGGFMNRVDLFDAKFFSISPREAELMDPQQRLFLETVWEVMEDAGYRMSALADTRTGMFVGVSNSDYSHLLAGSVSAIQAQAATGLSHSIIANRVSYWLDLRGPSEVINTACSSSLVAVHRAVESLHGRGCDMAFAGGVNVIASPTVHVAVGKVGILSPDGTCRTFDRDANGIVRGEGVGAVLLKPLDRAVEDGDHIYCVIKSTGENHGGRSTSLTAPNPNAQASLLKDVYTRAHIPPDSIGYIECHGTGTRLGDPVEVNGLKKAFEELASLWGQANVSRKHCGLGSVKTNVGHLEAAAGIAGVCKVVLSLLHKKIPATINFNELNSFIQFAGSPFYVVRNTTEWKRLSDGNGGEYPRRAGISSFGLGGTNAHIVLEEYQERGWMADACSDPQIVVLSAMSVEVLRDYAKKMAGFLERFMSGGDGEHVDVMDILAIAADILAVAPGDLDPDGELDSSGFDPVGLTDFCRRINERFSLEIGLDLFSEFSSLRSIAGYLDSLNDRARKQSSDKSMPSLQDIAYTAQVGREPLKERLAIVCRDHDDLFEKLNRFCADDANGAGGIGGVYRGTVGDGGDDPAIDLLMRGKAGAGFIETVIDEGEFWKLARLWVMGAKIDWELLHSGNRRKRVSLPTYPFSRQRYWLPVLNGEKPVDFLLAPRWVEAPLPPEHSKVDSPRRSDCPDESAILIFYTSDADGIAVELKNIFNRARVILVKLGVKTERRSNTEWEIATNDPQAAGVCCAGLERISRIYFLGGLSVCDFDRIDLDEFDRSQDRGIFTLFRLLKALEKMELLTNDLELKVATGNAYDILPGELINPCSAGLLGFTRSLARELFNLNISAVDVGFGERLDPGARFVQETSLHETVKFIVDEPPHKNGEIVAFRKGKRYVQEMRRASLPSKSSVPFRRQGVYLIVGGGKGIGFELARHLARTVQARVILLGRSRLDDGRKEAVSSLSSMGGDGVYFQTDITDLSSVQKAIGKAISKYGAIHGVFHSAVVLKDKTVANMNEHELRSVLEPKTKGSVILYKALCNLPLDFMMFFSSAVSFTSNPGQSNYAAASTFKDSFAHYLNQKNSFPVKIVNWGFWGSVGVVSSEEYIDRMSAQGVRSITPAEGLEIVERLLESSFDQIIALKADDHVLEKLGVDRDERIVPTPPAPVLIPNPPKSVSSGEWNAATLNERLKTLIGEVLHYDSSEIEGDKSLTDLGVDSVLAIEIASQLSGTLRINLNPTHLYNYSTIERLARFISEELSPRPESAAHSPEPENEDDLALRLLERLERGELDVDGVDREMEIIFRGE